jgi:hypothetical protein
MSEVKVNKVSPRSGTNVQLGDSGDTITVPSGATLDASNAATTLPANVITTTGTQTLTNKTIGSSQLTGALPALDGSALTGIPDTIAPTRHSIRPSLNLDFANSKVLDPRITFTRGSNATYYDGYTSVKAEENLIQYSQEFDNSYWNSTRSTIVDNAVTAPDGTTTASTYTETTDSSTKQLYVALSGFVSGKKYTYSIFAKANGRTKFRLRPQATSVVCEVIFDLSAETSTVSSGTALSHNITDVGNSWYRCDFSFTATGTGSGYYEFNLLDASGNTSYTGDGTSGVYLWGAQAEQRDSLSSYTATSGGAITKYQPALQTAGNNVARFDHNPTTGESLGLLIEESRTNVATYSEEFDNGSWSTTRATISGNEILAPDGTLTADKLIQENGNTSAGAFYKSFALTLNQDYTTSIYAKAEYYDYIIIRHQQGDTKTWFNVSNGTIGTSHANHTASIEDVGNGWYRCAVTLSMPTSTGVNWTFYLAENDNTQTVTAGTGFNGVYFWGVQIEQGSFPTSYIKTTGSQVTRSDDDAVMNNIDTSDWYKFSGYSFYAEGNFNSGFNTDAGTRGILGATQNGDTQNRLIVGYNNTDNVSFQSRYAGTSTVTSKAVNGSTIDDSFIKVAISLDFNNFLTSVNGATGSSTTNLPSLPNLTELTFGRWTTTTQLNGCIKKVSYYPIHLTQNEINDLTEE